MDIDSELKRIKLAEDLGLRTCNILQKIAAEFKSLQAENARLQSAIDEANAQEVAITVRAGYVTNYNRIYDDESGDLYGDFYARPIPAQQSPAVVVPDRMLKALRASMCESSCDIEGGSDTCCMPDIRELYQMLSAAQSPRITEQEDKTISSNSSEWSQRVTEQDAREIAISFYQYTYTIGDWPDESQVSHWLSKIPPLLTKLNEANHAAYDPVQLLETARCALADMANAKDLNLSAIRRKADRLYWDIRKAMGDEEDAQ